MPEMIALSEFAVAVLRFRVKGYRTKLTDHSRDAFRELAAAGIMEAVPGRDGDPEADYCFTKEGWARRREYLDAAEAHLLSLEPRLQDRIDLSEAARELVPVCAAGSIPDADDATRPIYRELAKAGIMMPIGTFTKGDDTVFRFTNQGWERRFEIMGGCPKEGA
jgi:hypothetical protein